MDFIDDFGDEQAWDSYVESHPECRFCHLYAYRYLADVYGYKPRYLAFREGGRLVGVLPAFEVKSLFFGRRFVSQPFSEYGGLLLNGDLSEPDFQAIMRYLQQFTKSSGARALEMHGRQGIGSCGFDPYLIKGNAQSYACLPLYKPLEDILGELITYQVRKAVQKAQRSSVSVVERSDPETIVRDFYPFYVTSMNRLGVPPHRIEYYLRAKASYGDKLRIFWAIHDGAPIAGLLGFSCGKRINIINIVSDERFWEVRPNDLIHWEYIKWAHARGYQVFDFGSIRYQGQLHYKKKWGCIIDDHGYYYLRENGRTPEKQAATFDSSSPTMNRLSEMWSRFVPRRVSCFIGPFLRKHLVR